MMEALQRIAHEWACRVFGRVAVGNKEERALRIAEEAIELCQALDVDREKMDRLVNVVYGRPKGHWFKELGGVTNTLAIFTEGTGYTMDNILEIEVRRVLAEDPDKFTKRFEEKRKMGVTA